MSADVRVAGVGMVPFTRPSVGARYEDMGAGAVRAALADSGLGYGDVQEAYASYVYGDSTCGQVVAYSVGVSGIPIVNVNNNCASGSTALWQARRAIASERVDVLLAVRCGGERRDIATEGPGPVSTGKDQHLGALNARLLDRSEQGVCALVCQRGQRPADADPHPHRGAAAHATASWSDKCQDYATCHRHGAVAVARSREAFR